MSTDLNQRRAPTNPKRTKEKYFFGPDLEFGGFFSLTCFLSRAPMQFGKLCRVHTVWTSRRTELWRSFQLSSILVVGKKQIYYNKMTVQEMISCTGSSQWPLSFDSLSSTAGCAVLELSVLLCWYTAMAEELTQSQLISTVEMLPNLWDLLHPCYPFCQHKIMCGMI